MQVNGQSLEGMAIEHARDLIMGPIGSDVNFALMRNTGGNNVMTAANLKRGSTVSPAPMGAIQQYSYPPQFQRAQSPPGKPCLRTHIIRCV